MNQPSEIKMTRFSHGAGCGCKLSPAVLQEILGGQTVGISDDLLVGNAGRDDAAVKKVSADLALISTTDFFMPIVDSAFDFGRIASANAISDIYAMGGKPEVAISILGWPVDKVPLSAARQVIAGSREICQLAGIALAGGHSIDCPEPIFGLAVTGSIHPDQVKTNAGAKPGDLLFLTKPLGVGILATAQKKGILQKEHQNLARDVMVQLNDFGQALAGYNYVHALTDVTGFGLLGHLIEMCEAGQVAARLNTAAVPVINEALYYLEQGCIPGGTNRNWHSYGEKVAQNIAKEKDLLADPQTSGGLLIAIDPLAEKQFLRLSSEHGLNLSVIGKIEKQASSILVS